MTKHKQQRNEALLTNKKTFDTGEPCVHNHLSPRLTKTGVCIQCIKEVYGYSAMTDEQKARQNKRSSAYQKANRAHVSATQKLWRSKNPDKVRAYTEKKRIERSKRSK